MVKTRQTTRLDDLAFEALIRHRTEITPNSEAEYEVLMRHKLRREIPVFLQAIADGNQAEVEELLNGNPRLVELARGTVTTPSLDTIENVSAIQLAYILEDEKIGKVLVDAVSKLNNPTIKEKVHRELALKVVEVKEQESQFRKFDFTALVKAITHDQNLKNTGIASPETEKVFTQLKDYFKPKSVTKGRPFNMKDLQQAYEVYNKNFDPWNEKQLVWFLHHVVRFLLGRVAASYGQAFSNGISNPFTRSFKLKNYSDNSELLYYLVCHSSSLDSKFFVDIYYGRCGAGARAGWLEDDGPMSVVADWLKNYVEQKQQDWKNLSSEYLSQEHQDQIELVLKN